jgi:hypothetical protein
MFEVRVRRSCSQTKPPEIRRGRLTCPECGGRVMRPDESVPHRLVTEWMPLEEANHMAHQEAAREAKVR